MFLLPLIPTCIWSWWGDSINERNTYDLNITSYMYISGFVQEVSNKSKVSGLEP